MPSGSGLCLQIHYATPTVPWVLAMPSFFIIHESRIAQLSPHLTMKTRKQRLSDTGCRVLCPSCDCSQRSGFPVPVPFLGSTVFPFTPEGQGPAKVLIPSALHPLPTLFRFLSTWSHREFPGQGHASVACFAQLSFSPLVQIREQSRRENFNRTISHKIHFPLDQEGRVSWK